jgi:hypothetical protein
LIRSPPSLVVSVAREDGGIESDVTSRLRTARNGEA